MPEIKITPCTIADLHTLQDIAINSYGDHYLYLWFDGGMWYIDRCFSDTALKKELEDENAAFFLVYASDDELVGFIKLNINKALEGESEKESLELERIYLTKAASGIGIGKQIVDFTVSFAQDRGKCCIWLKAMDSSKAVEFYKQNGFHQSGTYILDFEQMKPEYRGMVIMKRELEA